MLTVICGGMFSEKSTELQRRGKRLERAGKKVIYFKPDMDTRYSENELITHDGNAVMALNMPVNQRGYLLGMDLKGIDALMIDEVQFFEADLMFDIEFLFKRYPDLQVIVAGLDLDFTGRPFTTTAMLMATAEEVVKLNAVCAVCGDDAWVSYKEHNGKRIELGTNEYLPMCRTCFNKSNTIEMGN